MKYICSAAFMAFTACTEDAVPSPEPSTFRLDAEIQNVVDASGEEIASLEMKWDLQDTIGVWNNTEYFNDDNCPFVFSGDNSFTGSLSVSNEIDAYGISAFWPYERNRGKDPSYISVKLPSAQVQKGTGCDIKTNGILVSDHVMTDISSGTVTLNFHTPCAVLKITVDASGTEVEDKLLNTMSIKSEVPVTGNMIYDLVNGTVPVAPNGREVTLTLPDTPSLKEPCDTWFVLYPDDLSGKDLSMQLICTDKSMVDIKVTPEALSLAPSRMNAMTISLADLIETGDAEISEYRVDLSADGTANCYVVSSAEKYKFRPTKGNSSDIPEGMTKVDWLWMSEADLLTNISYEKGMVTFDAGDKKGNAVIGAFNEGGEIVWSWHIWLTDDPTANLHYGMSSAWQIMDRNLGAVSTGIDDYLSYGLYYQWGRKDPFIGPKHSGTKVKREEQPGFTTATAEHVVNPSYQLAFNLIKNTDLVSGDEVYYTIAHPMDFICFDEESNGSGQSWFNSPFASLKNLWGYNEATGSSSKTIYDPCPPGYKVPHFNGDVYSGITEENIPVVSNADLRGVMFTGAGGSSYYPAAGFRDYTGGYLSYMGLTAVFWSAMTYQDTSIRGLKIEPDGKNYVNTNVKLNAAYGQSVRCVKE